MGGTNIIIIINNGKYCLVENIESELGKFGRDVGGEGSGQSNSLGCIYIFQPAYIYKYASTTELSIMC